MQARKAREPGLRFRRPRRDRHSIIRFDRIGPPGYQGSCAGLSLPSFPLPRKRSSNVHQPRVILTQSAVEALAEIHGVGANAAAPQATAAPANAIHVMSVLSSMSSMAAFLRSRVYSTLNAQISAISGVTDAGFAWIAS
jgi:hypothetical protein